MDTIKIIKTPYFVRALHEWMTDNNLTPYIAVNVLHPDAIIPDEYKIDDVLVLNISYSATQHLEMTNEAIMFNARFGGVSRYISIPIGAVISMYAKETGDGMTFEQPSTPDPEPQKPKQKTPTLRIVK